MSLKDYDIKSQENRWNEEYGVEEWVIVYTIPTTRVQAEQLNFRVSMANLLPDCDRSDIYAPCINSSGLTPDPEDANGQLLRVVYRRPPVSMILQPGRGILRFSSYSTPKVNEYAEFKDGRQIARDIANVGAETAVGSWFSTVEKYEIIELEERGVPEVVCVDWAANELAIYQRAFAWISMGGWFTINQVGFDNLKCSEITIQRRDADASVLESTWKFARNPKGWETSGVRWETVIAFDVNGAHVSYDPSTGIATDADGNKLNMGQFIPIRIRSKDSDVIRGTTDFSPIVEYFNWQK